MKLTYIYIFFLCSFNLQCMNHQRYEQLMFLDKAIIESDAKKLQELLNNNFVLPEHEKTRLLNTAYSIHEKTREEEFKRLFNVLKLGGIGGMLLVGKIMLDLFDNMTSPQKSPSFYIFDVLLNGSLASTIAWRSYPEIKKLLTFQSCTSRKIIQMLYTINNEENNELEIITE